VTREDKGSFPFCFLDAKTSKRLPAATCALYMDGLGTSMDHGVYGPNSFISCKGKIRGHGINACVSFLNQMVITDPGILRRDPVHALLTKVKRGRGIIIHVSSLK
jgi:hypothetical protein